MKFSNLYLPLVAFLILSSCSTVDDIFSFNKYYYKSGPERVQLDSENSKIINKHPVNINTARIEGALRLILVKYGRKAETLFDDIELERYSSAISKALKDATKNQDVVFTIEGWYKKDGFSDNKVTSGRVFYNKSGLNVIFGSILRDGNKSDTDPMVAKGVNPDLKLNPYVPGSRYQTVSSPYILTTIPNAGVFRPKEAKGRKDWLVFTPRALQARGPLTVEDKKIARASNIAVQGLRNELNALKQELRNVRQNPYKQPYNSIYQQPGQYYLPPQSPPPPYGYYPNTGYNYPIQQNPQINQQIPNSNRQISLKSLESMRERGLISEETYIKKVQELGY